MEEDPVSEDEESPDSELDESDEPPMEGETPPVLSSSIRDVRLRFDGGDARWSRPLADAAEEDAVKLTVGIFCFHRGDLSGREASESDTRKGS